jgi:hypothetical protein
MRFGIFVASSLLGSSLALSAWARPPHPPSYGSSPSSGGESFGYVTPALTLSKVSDDVVSSTAAGGELAYTYFASPDAPGLSAFGQAELFVAGEPRFATGLRMSKIVGFELGYAYRDAHAGQRGSTAIQLGLFLDLGRHLTLGGRMAVPFTSAARKSVGTETAFVLTLKAPVLAHGSDPARARGWPMFHWMGGG